MRLRGACGPSAAPAWEGPVDGGWQEGVARALRRGRFQGTVRHDLDPDETATFLIAMIEGYEVLAKNAQDVKVWNAGVRNIVGWLQSLRAPANRNRG